MTMTLDGTNGVTFFDTSLQGAAASPYVLKNRIINGDCRIDQRNAGASITPTVNATYSVDRFKCVFSQASKYSAQQNAGSVTPPTGYTNYLGITSTSAYSILSTDSFQIEQIIEGYNIADLAWGTANAKTITISFWAYSSLTGTFSGFLSNSAGTQVYPFGYTILSANTWQQISITIAGSTTGTWLTTNGTGLRVVFNLGQGSAYVGSGNAWNTGGTVYQVTGSNNIVSTNGATWYVTGVQLEQNTVATPFERRLYNQELEACQRYCIVYKNNAASSGDTFRFFGSMYNTTTALCAICFPVPLRVAPTGVTVSGTFDFYSSGAPVVYSSMAYDVASTKTADVVLFGTSYTTNAFALLSSSTSAKIEFTGTEL